MDGSPDRNTLNPVARRVLEAGDAKRKGAQPPVGGPPREVVTLTSEMLHAGKTKKGGFTRAQAKALGVDWPLQKGWLKSLVGCEVWKDSYELFLYLSAFPKASTKNIPQKKTILYDPMNPTSTPEERKAKEHARRMRVDAEFRKLHQSRKGRKRHGQG